MGAADENEYPYPAIPANSRVVVCAVSCVRSEDHHLVASEHLLSIVGADTIVSRVVYTVARLPGEVSREVHSLRVGDYFTQIRAKPVGSMGDPGERRTTALELYVKPGVSSAWKAVVIEILKLIRTHAPGVRAEIVTARGPYDQGDVGRQSAPRL
jgi:hypothetical protein